MNKKLFQNAFIFILGEVINKSIPFLLLPILTRYLNPEDYGIIAGLTVLIAVFSKFTGLQIHGAINVNYFKMKRNQINQFIGNCLIILGASTLLVFVCVFLFSNNISERLKVENEWIYVALVIAFTEFLTTINLLLWTVEKKPKPYSVYQLTQTLTVTILTLVFVVGMSMNWEGRVLAIAIGTVLFSGISFVFLLKRGYLNFKLNKNHIKDALKFGIPLTPHSLSELIKTGADRIIIMSTIGIGATGIYSIAYEICSVISVLVIAFQRAWSPYMFETLSNDPTIHEKKKIVKFTYLYFIGIFLISVIFSWVAELFLPYFLGEKFNESSQFVPFFAISFAFSGMYTMVSNYFFYVKKTYLLSFITITGALFHLGMLYFLTLENGVIGAAQANLISFIFNFLITWYLSNRVYQMPWKLWKSHE
tara:strand:- start:15127 stop:16389 length:1263 start_codon:yes stop_codon:yes gene_type:complete